MIDNRLLLPFGPEQRVISNAIYLLYYQLVIIYHPNSLSRPKKHLLLIYLVGYIIFGVFTNSSILDIYGFENDQTWHTNHIFGKINSTDVFGPLAGFLFIRHFVFQGAGIALSF